MTKIEYNFYKFLDNWHDLNWKERFDAFLHAIHAPGFIQRPVCDWIDRKYYF